MNIQIRRPTPLEFDQVIRVTWETFLEFEAPDYDENGINQFKNDIIVNESFKDACMSGKNIVWGAFDSAALVGVMVIRERSHIALCFVQKEYQRKGVATQLFYTFLEEVKKQDPAIGKITVNSSPYGIPFYHRVGFVDTNTEQTIDGIRFTPMVYTVSNHVTDDMPL